MDRKKFITGDEGYEKKGGIGKKPNTPRPNPPRGQGIFFDYISDVEEPMRRKNKMDNFEYIKKLDKKGLAEFLYYDVLGGAEEPCFICGLCDKCKETDGDVDCLDGIKRFLDDKHSI